MACPNWCASRCSPASSRAGLREIKVTAPEARQTDFMDQSLFGRRPLILVVDDDEAVRRALAFALDLQGYDVETFGSGEALLLREAPGTPACLVLDQRLPGVTGLTTLEQLRNRHVDLPAILVTSHPGPALRDAAARAGVPILEKPLLSETLVSTIQRVLADPST